MVPGRGTDEATGFLGEQVGDGARVAALDRFAGEDHGAAVDVGGLEVGVLVAAADEARELVDVDGVVREVRREQDR